MVPSYSVPSLSLPSSRLALGKVARPTSKTNSKRPPRRSFFLRYNSYPPPRQLLRRSSSSSFFSPPTSSSPFSIISTQTSILSRSRPDNHQSSPPARAFVTTTTTKMSSSSAMPAQQHHSAACCNVAPVVVKGYQEKGSYETVDGIKTYVTGPRDAKKGILAIYDIFGYFPQTLQGVDILAHSDEKQQYKVLLPDWFEGKPCPIEWYPPNTEEKQKNLGAWFSNWPPSKVINRLPGFMQAANAQFPDTEWAIVGYCWGGKIVSLVGAAEDGPFKAGAACHPAMVDPKDAAAVRIPLIMLPSQDEDADAVAKFEAALKVPHHVETFADQIHGWMAARGDLSDERVRDEYVRGYKLILDFFGKHF